MTAWEYQPGRWQELADAISGKHAKKSTDETDKTPVAEKKPMGKALSARSIVSEARKAATDETLTKLTELPKRTDKTPARTDETPATLTKLLPRKPMNAAFAEVSSVSSADFLLCFRKNTLAGETTPRNLAEQELLEVLATLIRQYKSLRLISADLTAVLTLVGTPERAARFMTAHAAGSILPCHAPGDAPAVATWEAPHVEESRRDGTPPHD